MPCCDKGGPQTSSLASTGQCQGGCPCLHLCDVPRSLCGTCFVLMIQLMQESQMREIQAEDRTMQVEGSSRLPATM